MQNQRSTLHLFKLIAFLSLASRAAGELNCTSQEKKLDSLKLNSEKVRSQFVSKFEFAETNKPSILVTWSGSNNSVLVVAMLDNRRRVSASVYRSENEGKSFENITRRLGSSGKLLVQPDNGLQHNSLNSSRLYIVCASPSSVQRSDLYISMDSGRTWTKRSLPFALNGPILFHPTKPDLLLASSNYRVYVSTDAGHTWALLKSGVYKVAWAERSDSQPDAVYVAYDKKLENPMRSVFTLSSSSRPQRLLLKSGDFGRSWQQLADSIHSFKNVDKFLYVSVASGAGYSRSLRVSVDYGTSFHSVQLPAIKPGMFYSILDVSDGLVFVHVQASSSGGSGTLYTSDSSGRRFSESLRNHLYPPFGGGNDFYRVASMRGTYLATMLHSDKSMHSVITHDRGAVWHKLPKPEGGDCKDRKLPCMLQVASHYSRRAGVPTQPPMSVAGAVGLLLAHGHSAPKLQRVAPDVFVSNDGGYSWRLGLRRPHLLRVVNNGGVLVAVPQAPAPRELLFSTDEGRCWHRYAFTNETLQLTGLLTEPGARSKSVAIWGYAPATKRWRIYVFDFGAVLRRQCGEADYEEWLSHGELNYGSRSRACVLGAKVTYRRLKPQSLCANDYNWRSQATAANCTCTKADYECEYGYTRSVNSLDCTRDAGAAPEVKICDEATLQRLVSDGYRKLPGNSCQGGFRPNRTRLVALGGPCAGGVDQLTASGRRYIEKLAARNREAKEAAEAKRTSATVAVLVPLCMTLTLLMAAVLAFVVLARLRERRRLRLAFQYSAVSAHGRREDAGREKASERILDPRLPAPGYSSTGNGACANDRECILNDTDDVEPIT